MVAVESMGLPLNSLFKRRKFYEVTTSKIDIYCSNYSMLVATWAEGGGRRKICVFLLKAEGNVTTGRELGSQFKVIITN